MPNLKIRGIAGIERADIDIHGITLLVGVTGAGKTTVADCAAAALTGNPMMRGITQKNRLGSLVRSGHDSGYLVLSDESGEISIKYPDAETVTEGTPLVASPVAAGQIKIAAIKDAERSKQLLAILGADPTKDDLIKAFKSEDMPDGAVDKVWKVIEDNGWDAAAKKAEDRGREHKGRWEQATGGERYGSAKSQDWRPEGWVEDLEGADLSALEQKLGDAQKAYAELAGKNKATDVDRERLETLRAELPETEDRLENAQAAHAAAVKASADAWEALNALPPIPKDQSIDCPHCGKGVVVRIAGADKYTLLKDEDGLSEEQIAKRRADQTAATTAVANAGTAKDAAERELRNAQNAFEQKKAEISKYEDLLARGESGDADALDAALHAVEQAGEHLSLVRMKSEAEKITKIIAVNAKLVEILRPDGLRKKKLRKQLQSFNKSLADLSKLAGTPTVEIEYDLSVTFGGRNYALLSAGEKLVVDATLQAAVAGVDGSKMIVVDGGETAVGPYRAGLMKMISAQKIDAIICVAIKHHLDAPDLAKSGKGETYWVQDGEVFTRAEMQQEEAA